MKKILKSAFVFLLVVSVISCSAYITAFAAVSSSGSLGTDVTYSYSDGVLTVSGSGKINSYPGYNSPVGNNNEIKKIIVKSGITSLGNFCFDSCSELTEVSLPNTLTDIGNGVFY